MRTALTYTVIDSQTGKSKSGLTIKQINKMFGREHLKVGDYVRTGYLYKRRYEFIHDPQYWFARNMKAEWINVTEQIKIAMKGGKQHV